MVNTKGNNQKLGNEIFIINKYNRDLNQNKLNENISECDEVDEPLSDADANFFYRSYRCSNIGNWPRFYFSRLHPPEI